MNRKQIRDMAHYVVAFLVILAVGYTLKKLFASEIPLTNRDALMVVIGNIMGWGTSIISYYYGSSKGSSDKTEALMERTNGAQTPNP